MLTLTIPKLAEISLLVMLLTLCLYVVQQFGWWGSDASDGGNATDYATDNTGTDLDDGYDAEPHSPKPGADIIERNEVDGPGNDYYSNLDSGNLGVPASNLDTLHSLSSIDAGYPGHDRDSGSEGHNDSSYGRQDEYVLNSDGSYTYRGKTYGSGSNTGDSSYYGRDGADDTNYESYYNSSYSSSSSHGSQTNPHDPNSSANYYNTNPAYHRTDSRADTDDIYTSSGGSRDPYRDTEGLTNPGEESRDYSLDSNDLNNEHGRNPNDDTRSGSSNYYPFNYGTDTDRNRGTVGLTREEYDRRYGSPDTRSSSVSGSGYNVYSGSSSPGSYGWSVGGGSTSGAAGGGASSGGAGGGYGVGSSSGGAGGGYGVGSSSGGAGGGYGGGSGPGGQPCSGRDCSGSSGQCQCIGEKGSRVIHRPIHTYF